MSSFHCLEREFCGDVKTNSAPMSRADTLDNSLQRNEVVHQAELTKTRSARYGRLASGPVNKPPVGEPALLLALTTFSNAAPFCMIVAATALAWFCIVLK